MLGFSRRLPPPTPSPPPYLHYLLFFLLSLPSFHPSSQDPVLSVPAPRCCVMWHVTCSSRLGSSGNWRERSGRTTLRWPMKKANLLRRCFAACWRGDSKPEPNFGRMIGSLSHNAGVKWRKKSAVSRWLTRRQWCLQLRVKRVYIHSSDLLGGSDVCS